MEAQRIQVKLFLDETRPARDLVPVLHRWIQGGRLDEILIDVVDYAHVHHGPGVALIAHAANYTLDEDEGRPGLLYARKRDVEGDFPSRLASAARSALYAARALEEDAAVRFRGDALVVRLADRLLAPNTDQTFAAVAPDLLELAARLWPESSTVERVIDDPRALFAARLAGPDAPAALLLARLFAYSP